MSNLPINNQYDLATFLKTIGRIGLVFTALIVVLVAARLLPQTHLAAKSAPQVAVLDAPLAVVNGVAESAPFIGSDYEDIHAQGPFPYSPWTEHKTATIDPNEACGAPAELKAEGFVDDEPVLFTKPTAWEATSTYVCERYPHQTKVEHERTVYYRIVLLDPKVDWRALPAGTPFMSKRGIAG